MNERPPTQTSSKEPSANFSHEAIEQVMQKVQNINAPGTAYTVIGPNNVSTFVVPLQKREQTRLCALRF